MPLKGWGSGRMGGMTGEHSKGSQRGTSNPGADESIGILQSRMWDTRGRRNDRR